MEKQVVATTRKLPWMRSAVPKKREEATSKSKPKAAAATSSSNAGTTRAKGAQKKSKGKEDEEPEEEMKPEASPSTSSKPQGVEMAREEDEEQEEEEVAKKPAQPKPSTKRPENMIKAIEGRAGDPAKKPAAATQVGGGRLKTRLNRRRNNNLAAVAKANEVEEEEEEEVEKPPVSGTTSSSAGALEELPTQLDVPLLATSTQLDELPTQVDHSPLRSSRGRAKTKRAKAERVVASRSPSLSPNPYHLLLDQATQSDSPMLLLSASSSPLATPPRSPTTPSPQHSSYHRHLDSPTQHDGGAPRSPWALSPVAPSSPSSPGTTGKRKRRADKAKKAKAALASSSSTTTTGPTASQWRRLMSQATQTDLISSSPSLSQSQSQGDSSVAYDDLDAMLGQSTQTEDEVRCHISQSSDLLHRPTQSDDGGLLGGVSPIRLRSGGRERNLGPPSPCASPLRKGWRGGGNNAGGLRPKGKALEEDTSLDTSLLLLDTSTQDDEVYLDDYAKGGVYEEDEDEEDDASSSWKAASKKNSEKKNKEKSKGLSPGSLDSSLMGPTQEDPPSSLMRAPTQVDALNTSTQIDLSMFVLSDTEGESLGSIPTQADLPAFNLLGSSGAGLPPTLTDDNPTQIDSQPTQLDTSLGASSLARLLEEQSTDKKRKKEKKEKKRNSNKKATIQETPTLVDALVYEPTPPLEFEDEESPGTDYTRTHTHTHTHTHTVPRLAVRVA
jgi:hypothetical protein